MRVGDWDKRKAFAAQYAEELAVESMLSVATAMGIVRKVLIVAEVITAKVEPPP
jgi:hypothetical protein